MATARLLGTLDAGLAESQIDSAIEQTTAHGRGLNRFDFSIALLTARFTGRTPNPAGPSTASRSSGLTSALAWGCWFELLNGRISRTALANPNIKPWAKEIMKRENDKVLAGGIGYSARSSCTPAGVPAFMGYAVVESIHFLQTPKQVTMIFSGDEQVRRVYLDVPHSGHLKPSRYGESVGHYEGGDTLVVDTIGQNDKTYLDGFHTPHTEKLHVVERYKLIDDGKTIQVRLDVDDPDTFYEPWTAIENLRRVRRAWHEEVCAENNALLFDFGTPVANKPDF